MKGLANNGQQQARLRQLQKRKQARYDADLLSLMQRPEGRRFVWRIIDDTSACLSVNHSVESYVQGVHNGKREIGFKVWREAQRVAPAEFTLMFQEAQKQQADDEVTRKDAEAAAKKEDETAAE